MRLGERKEAFLDWMHMKTCGSYSIWFRVVQPLLVECPCCSFYRGLGIGLAVAGLVWVF